MLSYQWRKDGISIPDAVLSHLSFSDLKISDTGQYDVTITNDTGSITSSAANIEVVIDRTAKLSWSPPTTRVNGTSLTPDEISSYRIYHSTDDGGAEFVYDIDADENSFDLADLQSGDHYFAITAIDINGYESDLSNVASKQIVTGR